MERVYVFWEIGETMRRPQAWICIVVVSYIVYEYFAGVVQS